MTYLEFINECSIRLINPSIVFEDVHIKKALLKRDDKIIIKLLNENF